MEAIDALVSARWIVPIEPSGLVLEDHCVALDLGRIKHILPVEAARTRFRAKQTVHLAEHVLMPGLVNLHTHAAMSLMRGLADDLPLMKWLQQRIWPAEAQFVSPEFVYDGTLLACAEMLRAGVTCFNDMYFFPEAAAQAARRAKMRAALGVIVIEFASSYATDAEAYLHKGLATRDAFRGESLLTFCLAPHAPYSVSDKSFRQVLTYADQLDLPIHLHLHETDDEIEQSLAQHGVRPIERLAKLGLLGPNLIAVHAVHLQRDEIALLAQHGCHVAHCPASNLKLGSGMAPVATMLEHGINVGVGTDGTASNNRLDILAEARLAALLAKGLSKRADTLTAPQALAMATINGASALGLDAVTGSLKPGKAADMIAIDLSSIETTPCYDVISHLVYAASREHVSHVWVDGELLLEGGHLTQLDPQELTARGKAWRHKISP